MVSGESNIYDSPPLPIIILFEAEVEIPENPPKKMLEFPVVLYRPDRFPKKLLPLPSSLNKPARSPKKLLLFPVILL